MDSNSIADLEIIRHTLVALQAGALDVRDPTVDHTITLIDNIIEGQENDNGKEPIEVPADSEAVEEPDQEV